MARKAAKKPGTAVANWKSQLAEQAEIAKGMEKSVGSSAFFSIRGGQLTYNDQSVPGNEMIVVVLDYILENKYYTERYDPDNPAIPECFAFGIDEDELQPHEDAVAPQNEFCKTCDWNKYKSGENGKGKACRNSRRLALMSAGSFKHDGAEPTLNTDADFYESADIVMLGIPPTALRGWAKYVKEVVGLYGVPPLGVFTHVKVQPHATNQVEITFAHIGEVTDEMGAMLMQRQDALRNSGELVQPYIPIEEDDAPPARRKAPARKRAPAKKKATGKSRGSKY